MTNGNSLRQLETYLIAAGVVLAIIAITIGGI
jgi:hypothetical protein